MILIGGIKSQEDCVMLIEYPGRNYELKANNHDECLLWIRYLTLTKNYALINSGTNKLMKANDLVDSDQDVQKEKEIEYKGSFV